MDESKKYKPNLGSDSKWYPDGPGNGLDYYSGFIHPNLRWDTKEEVTPICAVANIAYAAGYDVARYEIRKALGLGRI